MDHFRIPSASGTGCLEFFERTPADRSRPLERFKVRVTDLELSAVARVYVESTAPLESLFDQMSDQWKGWDGVLSWESLEGDLTLRCSQDRAGHVAIAVELRSGSGPGDWTVLATIQAEAGQLEDLARRAGMFFATSGVSEMIKT